MSKANYYPLVKNFEEGNIDELNKFLMIHQISPPNILTS